MTGETKARPWRGFSAPLSANGEHQLYGPPPWRFEGYASAVRLQCQRADVAAMVPDPLIVPDDPIVELGIFDCVCDYGMGEEFVQRNPDLTHFREGFARHIIQYDGNIGYWHPYIWCDSDAEIAIGRELYGWPHKLGSISLTHRPFRGWRAGDIVTGLLARQCRAVMEIEIALQRPASLADIGLAQPPAATRAAGSAPGQTGSDVRWGSSYTQVALPEPIRAGQVRRRLVRNQMQFVEITDIWGGVASFKVHAPELQYLRNARSLGGRWHTIAWTKPYPVELIADSIEAA